MSEQKLEAYFFTAVFIGMLVLTGVLFYPFLGALTLALVLAILVAPLYQWLLARIRKPGLTSGLVVLIVMLAIIFPAMGLLFLLIDEATGIADYATSVNFDFVPRFVEHIDGRIHDLFPASASITDSVDLATVLQKATDYVSTLAAGVITGTIGIFFKLFIVIIALFFFLRDGKSFVQTFVKLSPLTDDEDARIVSRVQAVTRSLIRGTLVIAVLQGLLAGIGFLVFGVPNPVLWGSVAAVGALVPTVGTSIVIIPGVLYLFFVNTSVAAAIGLAAWGLLIVGLVDNIIGPKLIGERAQLHPLFVLLSVLGGLALFGISGFILGPLIFGVLVALAEIYKVKIQRLHEGGQ